jgi:hypothetical protein
MHFSSFMCFRTLKDNNGSKSLLNSNLKQVTRHLILMSRFPIMLFYLVLIRTLLYLYAVALYYASLFLCFCFELCFSNFMLLLQTMLFYFYAFASNYIFLPRILSYSISNKTTFKAYI